MLSSTRDDSSLEILVQKVDDVICAIDRKTDGRMERDSKDGQMDGQRQMDEWTGRQRQTCGWTDI